MMKSNAREEFQEHAEGGVRVKCARIIFGKTYVPEAQKKIDLPIGYTPDQYQRFLEQLDFAYDDGFGSQELFGFIWYEDGTWSERGEYDGSEWWERQECPPIPDNWKEE